MARPRALVVRAPGTNCDEETAHAWERAGAVVEAWHVNRLIEAPGELDRFQILTIPGGFSYGDDLARAESWPLASGPCLETPCVDFTNAADCSWASATGFRCW